MHETNQEKLYEAKVLKGSSNLLKKEINTLNTLKSANNKHILNIIYSGEGLVRKKNHPEHHYAYCAKCSLS